MGGGGAPSPLRWPLLRLALACLCRHLLLPLLLQHYYQKCSSVESICTLPELLSHPLRILTSRRVLERTSSTLGGACRCAVKKESCQAGGSPCPQEPCSDACPKHVKGGSSWLHRACSPPPPEQLLLPLTKSPLHRQQAPNHGPGSLPCARMASPCIKICSSDTGETHSLAAIGFNRSKPSFELAALGRTSLPTFNYCIAHPPSLTPGDPPTSSLTSLQERLCPSYSNLQ